MLRKIILNEEDFKKWPFTVSKVTVIIIGTKLMVISRGSFYALNGSSEVSSLCKDINRIWRDNPEIPGTKISLSEVINFSIKKLKGN